MTETIEQRRKLAQALREKAGTMGFAMPAPVGDPPPEDPELRAKWEARALEEVKSAPRIHRYDSGKGYMVEAHIHTTPKATPAPAPQARVRQAAQVDQDEVRRVSLTMGITDLQAAEFLKGDQR